MGANFLRDIISFVVTLVTATLRDLPQALLRLVPYIGFLVLFGGFVFWNGGVVLGKRRATISTIEGLC